MGIGLPKRFLESLQAGAGRADLHRTLNDLIELVNQHDTFASGHSDRVARYAAGVARVMGLSQTQINLVRRAGLVHDIGKISIPEKLLMKRGSLNEEETHLVRLHPIFGAAILSRIPHTEELIPIVVHHHEAWDGSGYPAGLAGVDIPIEARIIHIADAFDAMTAQQPYGRVRPVDEALVEVRNCSGHQFDPLGVDALHEAHRYGLLDDVISVPAGIAV
jgi:putative nucleotidyltransferase with HDIG domain